MEDMDIDSIIQGPPLRGQTASDKNVMSDTPMTDVNEDGMSATDDGAIASEPAGVDSADNQDLTNLPAAQQLMALNNAFESALPSTQLAAMNTAITSTTQLVRTNAGVLQKIDLQQLPYQTLLSDTANNLATLVKLMASMDSTGLASYRNMCRTYDAFPFRSLPPELRRTIVELAIIDDPHAQVHFASKFLHQESVDLIFGAKKFCLPFRPDPTSLGTRTQMLTKISRLRPEIRPLVKTIQVPVNRYAPYMGNFKANLQKDHLRQIMAIVTKPSAGPTGPSLDGVQTVEVHKIVMQTQRRLVFTLHRTNQQELVAGANGAQHQCPVWGVVFAVDCPTVYRNDPFLLNGRFVVQ